jgi:tetratricopeptide (TPR) repeat protein
LFGGWLRSSLNILGALLAVSFAASLSAAQITLAFPASHKVLTLSVPDQPAAMQLDILHLKVEKNTFTPDGSAKFFASGGSWVLSANVSPATRKLDAKGLREYAWSGLRTGPFETTSVRNYEIGDVAILEYMIDRFKGQNVHQKNVFAYMVSGDQWFDVHISKVLYDPSDEKFMKSMLDSVKLIEHYQPDTRVEFEYGSFFYLQSNWTRASQHYERALDIERRQKKRALSPTEWRVLIDNLGMAYGMLNDLERAKTTFQFGITQDPAYPMFHYNLACAYAELNDLDSALADLKTAFTNRQNGIPGEGMPDPAKDSSFERYLGDTRFVNLAARVCPESRKTAGGFVCK